MESGRKYFCLWGCYPTANGIYTLEPSVIILETQGPHSGRMEFLKCRTHWHRTTRTLAQDNYKLEEGGHKLFLMRNRRDFDLFCTNSTPSNVLSLRDTWPTNGIWSMKSCLRLTHTETWIRLACKFPKTSFGQRWRRPSRGYYLLG